MHSPGIRFVLVGTQHPGNIGAAARAMKNMAFQELVLVAPREFPHPEAIARASGADDVLARARVAADVAAAVSDCGYVVGTTARDRDQHFAVLDVREAAARCVARAAGAPVAILFGAERAGLTNEELAAAHALLRIPANPAYTSLNLGMAVQLVAYELHRALGGVASQPAPEAPVASAAEMERFYAHLETVLDGVGFHDRTASGTHLMTRLRRLFQRAVPDQNEVNILRGILAAIEGRRRIAGSKKPRVGAPPGAPPAA
jgi:TrmH family RNA methyltransferase